MGVISLDSYCRQKWPKSVHYHKPGKKVSDSGGPYTKFKILGIDANPFVYSAVVEAFETDTLLKQYEELSYDKKIKLVFDFTWRDINAIMEMVVCEEVFIAFDGVAPRSKMYQQRKRRYIRPLPEPEQFDTCKISCGTQFMQDLCTFIEFKIQETWENRKLKPKKIIFSGHTSPGEGEHNCLDYFRKYPAGQKVCMYGPDGDLIMLGLASHHDFYLFKTDYSNKSSMYTIRMKWIKEALAESMKTKQLSNRPNFYDYTKSFVFLGMFLGNDFVPRLEIFDVFLRGIDDMYTRYETIKSSIISKGRLDKRVFSDLLHALAKEEPALLALRNKYPWQLLEKHLDKGVLDFESFRKEYYNEWVHISTDKEIETMCHNYLDTIWWCWIYYLYTCPNPNHYYNYHYPPFCCDLSFYFKTWKIPKFEWPGKRANLEGWRKPYEQLVSIMPPNRKYLLPVKYHGYFKGESFPKLKNVVSNCQGKDEKEIVYELPMFTDVVDVQHTHKHARNTLSGDRVFVPGEIVYKVTSKWGTCVTKLSG